MVRVLAVNSDGVSESSSDVEIADLRDVIEALFFSTCRRASGRRSTTCSSWAMPLASAT